MSEEKKPTADSVIAAKFTTTPHDENRPRDVTKDLLELSALRLPQDFDAQLAVKKIITAVPITKPNKFAFIRVHPTWEFATLMLELKEERETYIVLPGLREHLPSETTPVMLVPVITRQAVLSLWPLRLPREDGRHDQWARTAMVAATEAKSGWVRVSANMQLGGYDVLRATANWPDAEWPPDMSFDDIIRIALRERLITSHDHPVLRRLRGTS
jgi:hypothetical protein